MVKVLDRGRDWWPSTEVWVWTAQNLLAKVGLSKPAAAGRFEGGLRHGRIMGDEGLEPPTSRM